MTKFPIHNTVIGIACLTLLQACASAPEAAPDTTPLVKSAIVTSNIRNNGFKGQFANDTVHVRKTVANMQRIDDDFKFTGSIMGRLGSKQSRSEIIRLDKNLEWQLDNRAKRYRECVIGKCWAESGFRSDLYSEETAEARDEQEEQDACDLTMTTNDFFIKKTGASRDVNGFPADEYKVNWEMAFKDSEGKTARNLITIDLWTTPVQGDLAEAIAMQTSFEDALRQREQAAMDENFLKAAPTGSLELMMKHLLEDFDEADLKKIKALMAKATKIEGFPISRKIQWDAKNETCAAPPEPEEEDEDTLNTGSLKGLLASVGKQVVKQEVKKKRDEKAREIAMQPLLSIVEDIKSIEITEIRESQLSVPSGYKLDNRS